ncbi:MAG: putative aminocarboxymuconate-semialdehyde decarboxylase [Phenylobacterium sp.]|nr:putative aminocarboxymuconate-semialdehyde decarboxylase [Phenylobacterium sp.]
MVDFVFSADSHIVEPPEMWQQRVEPRFRDRAPRVVRSLNDQPGEFYVFEELKPIGVTRFFGAGHLHERQKWLAFEANGFDAAPQSVRDPSARLVEQDRDGVDGELLFPTMGMVILAAKDDELKAACFRAVNAHLAEYCAYAPNRLVGAGVVSLHDVPTAIRDLEAAVKMGLRGVLVTGSPGAEGFGAARLDPFWAAAQEMDIPLTMHDLQVRGEVAFTGGQLTFFMLPMEIQTALADMIVGGIFDRFPKLKVCSAENDVGWLPHFVHRLEHFVTKIGARERTVQRLPSEVVRENIWASTQFEGSTILEYVSKAVGADRIMWGSDYPHPDSTFPNSRRWIQDSSAGLPPADVAKIFGGNVAGLYKVDVDALMRGKARPAMA